MRVVAVLRKPLEGTVAQNCLTHGTGALNIDGCRVATGEEDAQGLARWNKEGDNGWKNSSGGANTAALRKENGQTPLGRWPSNVILQHLEGCKQDGVKRVKACGVGAFMRSTGKENGGQTGAAYGAESRSVGTEQINYADKDGKETIANWICEDGCPVAELDAQSGVSTTGDVGLYVCKNRDRYSGSMPRENTTIHKGDTGGASRFFKQVKK